MKKWRYFFPGTGVEKGRCFVDGELDSDGKIWFSIDYLDLLLGFHNGILSFVSVGQFLLYCFYHRWPETHHEAETLGPFWGSSGEIWVVSGRGSWLHGFLTAHVGADPREESHCRWLSPAPLAQLLSPSPAPQQRPHAAPPLPSKHFPLPFQVKLFLQGFLGFGRLFILFQHVHLGLLTWPCGDSPTAIGHPRWIWPWLGFAKD